MTEILFIVEEAAEGGYTARAVGPSIFTEADNLDQLRDAVRDAVRCHMRLRTQQSGEHKTASEVPHLAASGLKNSRMALETENYDAKK